MYNTKKYKVLRGSGVPEEEKGINRKVRVGYGVEGPALLAMYCQIDIIF